MENTSAGPAMSSIRMSGYSKMAMSFMRLPDYARHGVGGETISHLPRPFALPQGLAAFAQRGVDAASVSARRLQSKGSSAA
jgi:hypothetical protein